ncbi:Ubiquinone/menaquinone biosynthesis C-methyltransferase UbiE [Streptomyces sp. RB5]|uniref:Ubiquinone/menaquinone biosynthesis C-methyltransferase UbiE n=1 Tax=Streptomyces smaragdinus TaxID=2585196 RepID=A0A7K0CC30_9ACTN|nr:class I SAM-dependent methyltransferase [Streptomyces smaragdinus]MQY10662.1 Ubiquinone/menaquinone biosynthesis C-methyltransferase UbiE [Streptomyces smaragdinus]
MTAFDESERRIWAGRADAFAGSFARLCAYPVSRLLDAAGVAEGVRVLDVGTGTGTAAAAACGRGARVTAVDAEPSMVARAARAVPGADVRLAALPELPFADGAFDAVVGNFVVNHVGRPRAALAELRRVTRPGGRIAVTVWALPAAAGQALLGRAVEAAGVGRPAHLPMVDPGDDFSRTEAGLAGLLDAAGLADAGCETLRWDHRTTAGEWWSGPASGAATIGQIVTGQSPEVIEAIKGHFDALCAGFTGADGVLSLPHAALLAHGRA